MSNNIGTDRIYAMLREVKSLSMEISLTEGLQMGSKTLADVYNRCLTELSEDDPAISTLFLPLKDDVSVDEIGVSAALLSRYMKPNRQQFEDDDF
ncbi:MAG: hypothetical protein ACO1OT_06830 [Heyndrickxia sp.]